MRFHMSNPLMIMMIVIIIIIIIIIPIIITTRILNEFYHLCHDAGAVLHQLSYQANQEQVVTWVDYKPVDVEMDDENKILM